MAERKYFVVSEYNDTNMFVEERTAEFKWHSGFAISQKQKSILEFHNAIAKEYPSEEILEISSKSINPFGVALSAFNLMITHKKSGNVFSVESAFQSSKVFQYGGPYVDLLEKNSKEAKKDERLRNSGKLICFKFYKTTWKLEPKTSFYDWLYINAVAQNDELRKEILKYKIFTDIEFNHNKSINCQARAAALYVSLFNVGLLKTALESLQAYHDVISTGKHVTNSDNEQLNFFDQ